MREIVDRYRVIAKRKDLDELRLGSLETHREVIGAGGIDGVFERIAAFQPSEGWLRYQSHIMWSRRGDGLWLPADGRDRSWGFPLSGEFARDDGKSLHLRPDGRGGWALIELIGGKGNEFLAQRVMLKAEESALSWLHYDVYWAHADDGIRQSVARFVGFVAEGG